MTGYRGRFSIVEILVMTPELERMVSAGLTADKIAVEARRAGMRSLWQSGLRHVANGESSIEELLRVTDVPGVDDGGGAPPLPAGTSAPAVATAAAPGPAVTVPVAPPEPHFDLTAAFELIDDDGDIAELLTDDSRGVKVLLVDDEDQLRRVMRDLLERDGYTVAEARDGPQALDQVDQVAPDIIVLDLNLPTLDGYAVLSELRSRPATRDIPIIVLTAKGDEDNEVRVFELGADDFLTKPFRARALSARLGAVLSRRRA
jgi:CheY-like chemotaxis protein